jgi:hypothetical protein
MVGNYDFLMSYLMLAFLEHIRTVVLGTNAPHLKLAGSAISLN